MQVRNKGRRGGVTVRGGEQRHRRTHPARFHRSRATTLSRGDWSHVEDMETHEF